MFTSTSSVRLTRENKKTSDMIIRCTCSTPFIGSTWLLCICVCFPGSDPCCQQTAYLFMTRVIYASIKMLSDSHKTVSIAARVQLLLCSQGSLSFRRCAGIIWTFLDGVLFQVYIFLLCFDVVQEVWSFYFWEISVMHLFRGQTSFWSAVHAVHSRVITSHHY